MGRQSTLGSNCLTARPIGNEKMKILFYMGRNEATKSGVSWKIWKIERKARTVNIFWGRAVVEKRKVVPAQRLQNKSIVFQTYQAAEESVEKRIKSKIARGYERRTRWRDVRP